MTIKSHRSKFRPVTKQICPKSGPIAELYPIVKKILLFDSIINGHHRDYLSHLITYWLKTQPTGELIVVAPASFEPTFRILTAHNPLNATVRFDGISQQDIDQTHGAKNLNRSLSEWNLALTYMIRHSPSDTLLMYFDVFQYGMLLGRKAPCTISGIYFRPDFYYPGLSGLEDRLRLIRKKAALYFVLNRGSLANLFCLDHFAVPLVQAMNPRVRVIPLPDPVKPYGVTLTETNKLRLELQIEPGRTVFLLFGHLDDRKGVAPLLDALPLLKMALRQKFCFVLVGPMSETYQREIAQKMTTVPPDIQVISMFSEIRAGLIEQYFSVADVVLTLYQRHIGMASILVRASLSGKPVISSDYGYMGHLVRQEHLGVVTDSVSPVAICRVLEQAVTEGIPYSAETLKAYAIRHTDETFAETIIGQLTDYKESSSN